MKNVAVFILLGQSNASGHDLPMSPEDIFHRPLKNVFGLSRQLNQSFETAELQWSGYESRNMNLGSPKDDTYSLANCLAFKWQQAIDYGVSLPDLYIVHISIGAQGVTEGYMWNPQYPTILHTAELDDGSVDISLFSFTKHIFSLLGSSFNQLDINPIYLGIHWLGGENDFSATSEDLFTSLITIYTELFEGFLSAIGQRIPIYLHTLCCEKRCDICEREHHGSKSYGRFLKNLHTINRVFYALAEENDHITVFETERYPQYDASRADKNLFLSDYVHYRKDVNLWLADVALGEARQKFSRS